MATKQVAGQDLETKGPKAVVGEVVQFGDKLIVPEAMSMQQAIDLLKRRMEYLNTAVNVRETFNSFPWDGANALNNVLRRKYGWASLEKTPGFFGDKPPQLINIEVGYSEVTAVPWGRFSLPTFSGGGYLQTISDMKGGMLQFALAGTVLRADEADVRALFDAVRQELLVNSIYRGKAIKIRFTDDDDGSSLELPNVTFMDTDVDQRTMIFSEELEFSLDVNLFVPIARHKDLTANGIALKRGVLLGGVYGTGKTLAAKVAAMKAAKAGATFIYVARAEELARAVSFAKQYMKPLAVVFCEDIDRAVHGERTVQIDDILNIIDGIDTKAASIMVILTTNHLERISPAMLRPGRLDAVIDVVPPDAKACERLIRSYAGDSLAASTKLDRVGEVLKGTIPAVIAEVVKRSKLSQLALQKPGQKVSMLSEDALLEAAKTMHTQLRMLNLDRGEKQRPDIDESLRKIVKEAVDAAG